MAKQNCWEIKECGREPGGKNESELGTCPTTTESRLDGVHSGKNAGRSCWVIAGTMCGGKVQGTFVDKQPDCLECDFYRQVVEEEGDSFILTDQLLDKL